MQTSPIRNLVHLILTLILLSAAQSLRGQTPHLVGWHSKQPFKENFARCFQKAYEAMERAQLQDVQVHGGWVVSGKTSSLRVAISCIQIQEGVMINIQVAAIASEERAAERMGNLDF